MRTYYWTIFLWITFVLIAIISCDNNTIIEPQNNPELLFVTASPIKIVTEAGQNNFPKFNVSGIESDLIYIGVFNEPINIINGDIQNSEALVWEWNKGLESKSIITFEDGKLIDNNFSLENVFCEEQNEYYWGAWAWENTGRVVEYSSPLNSFVLSENELPVLNLKNYLLVSDENNDGYINKNEEIIIKLTLENTSNIQATNISLTLNNPNIPSFPLVIEFDNINANEEASEFRTLKMPLNAAFGSQIPIISSVNFNECQNSTTNFSIPITGRSVCLTSATLETINFIPDLLFWDPLSIVPVTNTEPDVYFQLIDYLGDTIYTSNVRNNADMPPSITWPPVSPCQNLKLDETYTIAVYDYDYYLVPGIIDPPDFIGDISFKMEDYLQSGQTKISFSNNRLDLYFEVLWE